MLLGLDGVQDPFGLLTELRELQERRWRSRLGPAHDKIDRLRLAELVVGAAGDRLSR